MKLNGQNSTGETALMIFSLSSKKEAERKALFGLHHKSLSQQLFELLIDQTAAIADRSGVDVILIDESRQRGTSFAERYTNAFQDVFALGYEKILSIGNDCPELTTDILLEAVHLLDQQDLVLGPSTDGGIYLIGLNSAIFDEKGFYDLPWMTEYLFASIIQQARSRNIGFHCLGLLTDLDEQTAVIQYARRNPVSSISLFIFLHFTFDHKAFEVEQDISSIPFSGHTFSLRAPPTFC